MIAKDAVGNGPQENNKSFYVRNAKVLIGTLKRKERVMFNRKSESKKLVQKIALQEIEARFLEVADLKGNLATLHITKENHMQTKTDKEKIDKHGQVFTPLWLVDEMLDRVSDEEWRRHDLTTHDLCSGYGQFSIRMLRRRYEIMNESFDISENLHEYHLFSEIQPSSCFCLLYIFGTQIRLLIGDVSKLWELPDHAEHGIWVLNKEWHNRTKFITCMFNRFLQGSDTFMTKAKKFEERFNYLKNTKII